MDVIIRVGGKILQFAWKNRTWLIPLASEGWRILKRHRKINKLKRAKLNSEL